MTPAPRASRPDASHPIDHHPRVRLGKAPRPSDVQVGPDEHRGSGGEAERVCVDRSEQGQIQRNTATSCLLGEPVRRGLICLRRDEAEAETDEVVGGSLVDEPPMGKSRA